MQQPPDDGVTLKNFPVRQVHEGTEWYRAHRREPGPGYFASDGQGRFNLAPPLGTWYVATTSRAAAQEIIGPDFIHAGFITAEFIAQRSISGVTMPRSILAAQLTAGEAFTYRVSNELSTVSDYRIPQQWAAAFHRAGFNGIWYQPRFSSGKGRALAVFGDAGPFPVTVTHVLTLRTVIQDIVGLKILQTQDRDGYQILNEPLDQP